MVVEVKKEVPFPPAKPAPTEQPKIILKKAQEPPHIIMTKQKSGFTSRGTIKQKEIQIIKKIAS